MKGDFSRFTFDSKNRYSRVLMQQGRMQVDADWNEQLDISAYRTETEITDFIGQSGAPEMPQDKAVKAYPDDVNHRSTSFRITGDGTNLTIGPGRYYVGGMLFENPQAVSYLEQPDYPTPPLHKEPGIYLAYLDVWQHHITALEAPTIREPALGGADTATRVKNVWQVKLHELGKTADKDKLIAAVSQPDLSIWKPEWEFDKGDGQLTATLGPAGAIAENQLYRIEIHQGNEDNRTSASGRVSFKWSRDNGAIAAQVESVDITTIKIKPAGQDPQLAFPVGQLIELSTQALTLSGKPGWLATVQGVQGHQLTVLWQSPNPEIPKDLPPAIVRRWDSKTVALIGDTNHQHLLEQSIIVRFEANKRYKTGDYWLIPARALTGNIEWSPASQPPHGTLHRYCKLALVELLAENNHFAVLKDCRSIFKPITSGLVSKAGDRMTGDLAIDENLLVNGRVGIGRAPSANNLLAVAGSVSIGARFASGNAGRDGLLVEGNVGIGTVETGSQLSVTRGVAIGPTYVDYENGLEGSLLVEGNVGIGTPDPRNKLSVLGGVAIGYNSFDQTAALAINGNVGIGTTTPGSKLSVAGGVAIGSVYANQNVAPANALLVQNSISLGQLGNWRIQKGFKSRIRAVIDNATNTWGYVEATGLSGDFLILDDPGNLYICPINTSLLTGRALNILLKRPSKWTFSVLPTWTYQTTSIPGLTSKEIKVVDWREGQNLPGEMQDNENGADYVEGYRFWVLSSLLQPPPVGVIILVFTRIM